MKAVLKAIWENRSQILEGVKNSIIRDELVVHVSFAHKIIKHALDNWLDEYKTLKSTGQSSARYYNTEVYKRLGI